MKTTETFYYGKASTSYYLFIVLSPPQDTEHLEYPALAAMFSPEVNIVLLFLLLLLISD